MHNVSSGCIEKDVLVAFNGVSTELTEGFFFYLILFYYLFFLLFYCAAGGEGGILSRKSVVGVINDGWGGGWRDGWGGRIEMCVSGKGLTRPFSFCQNPK